MSTLSIKTSWQLFQSISDRKSIIFQIHKYKISVKKLLDGFSDIDRANLSFNTLYTIRPHVFDQKYWRQNYIKLPSGWNGKVAFSATNLLDENVWTSYRKSLSFVLMHYVRLKIKPFNRNCSIRGQCGTSGVSRQSHNQLTSYRLRFTWLNSILTNTHPDGSNRVVPWEVTEAEDFFSLSSIDRNYFNSFLVRYFQQK